MSLLTIIQGAAGRIGIPQPALVIGSIDPNAVMLRGLADQEGVELARRHPWQRIVKEATFATVASTVAYDLPTDFDRLIEGSIYNRTQTRPMVGPITAQRWQQLQAVGVTATWGAIYIRGGSIRITPTPTAAETIAYEYVSRWWCGTSLDTNPTQAAWAVDTDQAFLDEELMTLGVTWRFLRARGLDYSESFRTYEEAVATRMGHDGGQRILDLGPAPADEPFGPYVTDGNWAIY